MSLCETSKGLVEDGASRTGRFVLNETDVLSQGKINANTIACACASIDIDINFDS